MRKTLSLTILAFFCSIVLHSQDISYGTDLQATLESAEESHTYSFIGNTNDQVFIRMVGDKEGVDGCIQLLDAFDNIIAEDCPGTDHATIRAIIPQGGIYRIVASDRNNNDTGSYGLSLEQTRLPNYTSVISCASEQLYELPYRAAVQAVSIDFEAGDIPRIQMNGSSQGIEPVLEFYHPNGGLLAVAKQSGWLSTLESVTIEEAGRYLLLAYDENGNDTGTFGLSFHKLNLTECSSSLSCGQIIDADFATPAEVDAYRIKVAAGEYFSLRARGAIKDIETSFRIYNSTGEFVTKSKKMGRLAYLENWKSSEDDTYTVFVHDDAGNDAGEYAIQLIKSGDASCAQPYNCKVIEEELEMPHPMAMVAYTFNGSAGQAIGIKLVETDNDLEPSFRLYRPDGKLLKTKIDNSVAALNNYVLPEDGAYVVTIMDHEGNDQKNYRLYIEGVEAMDCDEEEPSYCLAYGDDTSIEWIERVSVGDIDHTSGNDEGYADFTEVVTDLPVATKNLVELTPGFTEESNPFYECWRVFIDANQDGDFDDSGEMVFFGSNYGLLTGSLEIPAYASLGKTRMRIAMSYSSYPEACGNIAYGEVEDYSVNLVPAVSCDLLREGWTNSDIGSPELAGSVCFDVPTGTFFIESGGARIDKKSDEFHFVSNTLCGDGEITARVRGLFSESETPLAGIMLRTGLDEDDINAAMLVGKGFTSYFQYRTRTNKKTDQIVATAHAPTWVKLKRSGDDISGFVSADGEAWVFVGSTEIEAGVCLHAGLAVSSGEENVEANTVIDQVNIKVDVTEMIPIHDTDRELPVILVPLDESKPEVVLSLYPNPTVDYVYVDVENLPSGEAVTVILFNSFGLPVYQNIMVLDGINAQEINLSGMDIKSGVYTLTAFHSEGQNSQTVVIANE